MANLSVACLQDFPYRAPEPVRHVATGIAETARRLAIAERLRPMAELEPAEARAYIDPLPVSSATSPAGLRRRVVVPTVDKRAAKKPLCCNESGQ